MGEFGAESEVSCCPRVLDIQTDAFNRKTNLGHGEMDDLEDANAAAAAEIAYLQKLGEDQKDNSSAFDSAVAALGDQPSILDQILTKKKTISFVDNFMKLSVEDLKSCQLQQSSPQGPFWVLNVNDSLCLHLRLVWLQGDVLYDFPDFFVLRDMSNATCKVIKTQSTTMSSNWLAQGLYLSLFFTKLFTKISIFLGVYCCVMGQLQEAGENPQIVALKLTNLSDNNNEVIRSMWPLEIHQLKTSLAKEDQIERFSSDSSSSSCSCTSSCSCSETESHSD
jgi:hypothetical protein